MTEFTKEELYEIEKVFDIYVATNSKAIIEMAVALDRLGEKAKPLSDKFVDSAISNYDMFRMISAKASRMRTEKENGNPTQ